MLSQIRYAALAEMAAAARDAATDDDTRYRLDQAWAALSTAARHAMFADRWANMAAGERQAAAQQRPAAGSGQVMTALEARAAESAARADRHRAAAQTLSELGERLQAEAASNPGKPSAPAD